ncbi:hypothetical protein Q1695_007014 [Nippostrongylus brasiliensis]|nr:hypothetical protein Q1695_007014 [Nippostrongylus brasiliensis]
MARTKGSSNLTQEIQLAIVRGCRLGLSREVLAQQFSVARTTINAVLKRFGANGSVKLARLLGGPTPPRDSKTGIF